MLTVTAVPNALSLSRLALIPVMWVLAACGMPRALAVVLLLAGLTDALDGWIARRFSASSALGAKLDSLADNVLIPCVVVWVWMLRREIITENLPAMVVYIALHGTSMAICWFRFRRFGNLHLYSAKAAAYIAFPFLAHAFYFGYNRVWFYCTITLYIISGIEEILVLLTRSHVDEHIGSIFKPQRTGTPDGAQTL